MQTGTSTKYGGPVTCRQGTTVRRGFSRLHSALWTVLWPARCYYTSFPLQRGKGLLQHLLFKPLLPQHGELEVTLPSGPVLTFSYAERLGSHLLMHGVFECQELAQAVAALAPGTLAFDIGANVGIYASELAAASPTTQVIAVEPLPDNLRRLHQHVQRNGLRNVSIEACALGDRCGEIDLFPTSDPAYATVNASAGAGPGALRVALATLDEIWNKYQRQPVSFIKLDVEGAELATLAGASEVLSNQRPPILAEANSATQREALEQHLQRYGYRSQQPRGFEPWNLWFTAAGAAG